MFDHTSVGQFLEKRFGITIPAISPWHRAVCGDLTAAFDFVNPNAAPFPELPPVRNSAEVIAAITHLPKPVPPMTPERLLQEPGVRRSRALPYELHVDAHAHPSAYKLSLIFRNTGKVGVVFHAYDRMHLDRIPRRYTVESGKALDDEWLLLADEGRYDHWVYGPNGFVREFRGTLSRNTLTALEVELEYDVGKRSIRLIATNEDHHVVTLVVRANAYRTDGPWSPPIARGRHIVRHRTLWR